MPVDFSSHSKHALEYAHSFARQFNANLLFIHVVEAFPIDYVLGLELVRAANEWLLGQSRAALAQIAAGFSKAGYKAPETLVTFGIPYREIAKVAKERRADLIILATHGYTGFKYIRLGSTAERVVRHAPCPVLVVRADTTSKRDQPIETHPKPRTLSVEVRNILVPVDFSPRSKAAVDYALLIAKRFNARIVLLHVVHAYYFVSNSENRGFDYPELLGELRTTGEKQLGDIARSIPKTYSVKTVLETGHPGNAIVDAAYRLGIDLIVIATHGRSGIKRTLLGSTAEFVVRHAPCPVLAMREQPPWSAKPGNRNLSETKI